MHKTLSDNDTLLFQNIEALSSRLTRLMSLHEDALAIVAQHADQQDQRHLYRLLIQRFKLENEVLTCFRRMELLTEGLLFNDDINSAHISNAVEHEQRSNRKFIDRMEAMLKKNGTMVSERSEYKLLLKRIKGFQPHLSDHSYDDEVESLIPILEEFATQLTYELGMITSLQSNFEATQKNKIDIGELTRQIERNTLQLKGTIDRLYTHYLVMMPDSLWIN